MAVAYKYIVLLLQLSAIHAAVVILVVDNSAYHAGFYLFLIYLFWGVFFCFVVLVCCCYCFLFCFSIKVCLFA